MSLGKTARIALVPRRVHEVSTTRRRDMCGSSRRNKIVQDYSRFFHDDFLRRVAVASQSRRTVYGELYSLLFPSEVAVRRSGAMLHRIYQERFVNIAQGMFQRCQNIRG